MQHYHPITDLVLFPLLVAAILGLGAPLRRRLWPVPPPRANLQGRLESYCLQYAFGLGVCAYLWFALCVARLLYPVTAWIALFAGWVLFALQLRRDFGGGPQPDAPLASACKASAREAEAPTTAGPSTKRETPQISRLLLAAIAVMTAALVLFQFDGALTPEIGHDALAYHLYTPRMFLWNHGLTAMPYNYQSHMPLNAQMAFLWGLLLGGEVLAKLLCWSQLAGTVMLLRAAGAREFGRPVGVLASFMAIATQSAAYHHPPISVNSDVPLTFFCAAAMVAFLRLVAPGAVRMRAATAAGLFCGFALGTKYTAISYVVFPLLGAAALAMAIVAANNKGMAFGTRARLAMAPCVAVGALAVGLFAPWMIRAAIETGDPLYPGFYQRFPVKAAYRAGAEIIGAWESQTQSQSFMMAAIGGDLLLPTFLVCGLVCLALGARRAVFLGLGAALAHAGLLVAPLGQWPRLFSVTIPLSAMAFSVAILGAPIARGLKAIVVAVTAVAALAFFFDKQAMFMKNPAHAWDGWPKLTQASALAQAAPKDVFNDGRLELYAYIGEHLPARAKILFSQVPYVFHCPRQAVAAGEWNEDYPDSAAKEEKGAAPAILARLEQEGFTHIVFKRDAKDKGGLRESVRKSLRLLYESGRFALYAIPPGDVLR